MQLLKPIYILLLCLIFSCSQKSHLVNVNQSEQTIDTRLLGYWGGEEKDNQIKGMTKKWKMSRTADGRFLLDFEVVFFGQTEKSMEEGTWWIEDGKFHEFHESSGLTDVYEYEVLNEDQIKFKAVTLSIDHDNEAYEFIDNRIKP